MVTLKNECMLLHAINATERGTASLCIQSPDTDALVLALWQYTSLCKETSVVAGTGAKRRSHPLGPLYIAVGDSVVVALPEFHTFNGCDQTDTICGKSKIAFWSALKRADEQVLEGKKEKERKGTLFKCLVGLALER